VLLLLSAFYSASAVAFFSLTPGQLLAMRANRKANAHVLELIEEPNREQAAKRLLATILVANNLVNVALILVSTRVVPLISPDPIIWADYLGISVLSFELLFNLVTVTLALVLFGEVIPKVYATSNNETFARTVAVPLRITGMLLKPITTPLMKSTGIFEKKYSRKASEISVDDLSTALQLTGSGERTDDEQKILEGIVTFGHKSVKQVMTSRLDMEAIALDYSFKEMLEKIISAGYSRFPVYSGSLDNMVGILFVKDVLPHMDKEEFDWHSLLRAPLFVPEGKKLDDLLEEFRTSRKHLALVVDEYGGTSGLISLEDILEEIVGDITDEFDEESASFLKLDEYNYVFEGKTPLADFFRAVEVDEHIFEEHKGESDTLAGFLIELSGRIPKKGEKIRFDRYLFKVESADRRKVKQIKMTIEKPEEEKA
jgi:putative hemolysin